MKESCFVAVSGGVDSAVSLLLLAERGFEVSGVTARMFGRELVPSCQDDGCKSASSLCASLGITHYIVNPEEEFRRFVVGDFIDAYSRGETPNPCVVCNKYIKFGVLADFAFSKGASKFATGHYVRIKKSGDRAVICKATCVKKDQSYVLWSLTQNQIKSFVAPLGELTKEEVREIAREHNIPAAESKESQDICFIPDGDYRAFLDRVSDADDIAGDFVLADGSSVGRHCGQRCYTIGQRKGLGVAWKEPLYVISRNLPRNEITLGTNADLYKSSFTVRDASFSATDYPQADFNCEVRVRYHSAEVPCRVTTVDESHLLVETRFPVRAPTPGQSAVFYDGETLLGGGIIC